METQKTGSKSRIIALSAVIALVQLLDIAIHVASGMVEPIRIAASVIILMWLRIVVSRKPTNVMLHTTVGFVGIYLLLNAIFLVTEGFTNPENGGQFRTVLFVLVGITIATSALVANTKASHTHSSIKSN